MQFAWFEHKARANALKHGVSFAEATTVFGDPLAATVPDPDHSDLEFRFVTMGLSSRGRLLVVSHTEEGLVFRLISAREASKHEKTRYEA